MGVSYQDHVHVDDSVASLLKLWSGGRSDQASRRKGFVVFGYALAAVARPLIGVISVPWQLFVLRVGDRIGKGVRTSPRDALIADSTDTSNRGRDFGFHRAMDHLGAATRPRPDSRLPLVVARRTADALPLDSAHNEPTVAVSKPSTTQAFSSTHWLARRTSSERLSAFSFFLRCTR